MTTAIKRRRGTTTQHSTFTGLEGEITIDTTKDTAVVHDGATAGGRPLLREDLANNSEVVTKTGTQTLTNKTLTSPVINTPTGITKGDISLGNVDNTSDATKNSATATLTNKTITLGANTISGTVAQFQAAVTDGDFATLAGTETFTNKALNGTLGATTPSTVAATTISASGVSTFSAGSAGAPAITNSGDTNTGIFFPAADTIAFAEGGVESMRIDSSGNVGIGTASPAAKLDVASGNIKLTDTYSLVWGSAATYISGNSATPLMTFTVNSAERMRLDSSGNLGLGTSSPNYGGWSKAVSVITTNTAAAYEVGTSATTTNEVIGALDFIQTSNTSNKEVAQILARNTGATSGNTGAYLTFSTKPDAGSVTERMRLDSSGNLGLGVTPSAWGGSWKAVDVSGGGAFAGAFNSAYMLGNAYYNASNGVYKATGPAGHYGIEAGTHVWKTAPSGTAGNAITFTQRMTLDASGNLLVGTTSALIANTTMSVQGSGRASAMALKGDNVGTPAGAYVWNATTTGNGSFFEFGTEASFTTRGSISYNRAGGLTAYNTTSDYRAKTVNGAVVNALSKVALLKPCNGRMNGATEDIDFFVAHELQEVVPSAVSGIKDAVKEDGTPEYQMVDKSAIIPLLTAAIQEQQAMIDELKAKVAALEAA